MRAEEPRYHLNSRAPYGASPHKARGVSVHFKKQLPAPICLSAETGGPVAAYCRVYT